LPERLSGNSPNTANWGLFAVWQAISTKPRRRALNRGQRLVELLKQNQFLRSPFSKQILIIFAGTGGFLDDLPGKSGSRF